MDNQKPQDKGLRKINSIWYVNIQYMGKRREFRIGHDKEKARAIRKLLKDATKDGTLQEKILEYSDSQSPEQTNEPEPDSLSYYSAVQEHWEQHLKFKKSGRWMYERLKISLKFFEKKDIQHIHWKEVESFRNQRLQEVAPSTVKQELDLMHAIFDRQIRMERIVKNPLDNVERPVFDNVREEVISHEEFLRLLNLKWPVNNRSKVTIKTIEQHLKLALVIADYTAMRIGEILDLKWLHIRNNFEHIYVPKTKTNKKRYVPIHPELARILLSVKKNGEYVIQKNGKKIKRIKKGFESARERAGLSFLHIHDFRHRAITRWVKEGHPVNAIMKATGHSTFSAFNRYANLKEGDIQVLVGRKTKPLPTLTYEEYYETHHEKLENVEKMWKVA